MRMALSTSACFIEAGLSTCHLHHYEIWEYFQSPSTVYAKALEILMVCTPR